MCRTIYNQFVFSNCCFLRESGLTYGSGINGDGARIGLFVGGMTLERFCQYSLRTLQSSIANKRLRNVGVVDSAHTCVQLQRLEIL